MAPNDPAPAPSLPRAPRYSVVQASRLCFLILFLTIFARPSIAASHPVFITTGVAQVHDQTLILHLQVSDHDVQHAGGDPADLRDDQQQARDLARTLSATDDQGTALIIAGPAGLPDLARTDDGDT